MKISNKKLKIFYIFGLIFGFNAAQALSNGLVVKSVNYQDFKEHEDIYNFIYGKKVFWGDKDVFFKELQIKQNNGIKCVCRSKVDDQIYGYIALNASKNSLIKKGCINLYMQTLVIHPNITNEQEKSQIIQAMIQYIQENYRAKSIKKICVEINTTQKLLIQNLVAFGFFKPWLKNCNFNFYSYFLEKNLFE